MAPVPGGVVGGGSLPTGFGGGGGGKAPGGGGDPPRKHYVSKGGDVKSPLWMYDVKAAKAYLLKWCMFMLLSILSHWLTPLPVNTRSDRTVNLEFIRELSHFLWQLQARGINLGPHLRLLVVHRNDRESYLSAATIRFANNDPPTVRTILGMGTSRGYYDTNTEASKCSPDGFSRSSIDPVTQ
jgi:hypothetical protein